MLITALRVYDRFYGEMFTVECPAGSGKQMTPEPDRDRIGAAAGEPIPAGRERASAVLRRATRCSSTTRHFKDHLLFHEFFHGDTGAGLGASHQTGWTGLVAKLIEQQAMDRAVSAGKEKLSS